MAGGVARVWGRNPSVVLVLSHGMTEHTGGYDRLATACAEWGWVVVGMDHPGHGLNASRGLGELGPDGWAGMATQLMAVIATCRTQWPQAKVVVMGHSMGAFLAQWVVRQAACPPVDGVVLTGVGWVNPWLARLGGLVAHVGRRLVGQRWMGAILKKGLFASFNRHVASPRTPYDWLACRRSVVDAYVADPGCGFSPPASFFEAMFGGIASLYNPVMFDRLPVGVPWLLVSGRHDPVCEGGHATVVLANRLKARGASVSIHLIPTARHVVWDDDGAETVESVIRHWVTDSLE